MDANYIRLLIGKGNDKYTDEELLSISPKILRDLYLKKFYDGTISGPLTGDIYKDKPWVQNYPEEANSKFLLDDTMYNTYIRETEDKLDEIAVITLDGKIYTHRELREMINSTAKGFLAKGLSEGSKIGVLLVNSVEEPITVLAISAIGGSSKMVDYSKGPFDAQKSIEESNLDMLVIDEVLLPMEPILNPNNLPIVVVNANNTYDNKFTKFEDLRQLGKHSKFIPATKNPNRIALTISSSGTTGPAKPIMHTDKTVNDSAQGFIHTDFPLGKNNIMLKAVPGFIGLGVITTMYTSLVTGTPLLLIDGTSPEELRQKTVDIIINFDEFKKKNYLSDKFGLLMFSAPVFIRDLHTRYDEITDLSYVNGFMVAGSKMSKDELDKIEADLKEKGLRVTINNAYGQNEHGGGVVTNSPKYNKNGCAGYPLIGRTIYIVDQDTLEVIKNGGRQGLVVEDTPTMFKGYENLPEKTTQSKLYLKDGKMSKENNGGIECFNSEDLGFLDEDGFLHITGRISRALIRFDFKLPLEKIEEKLGNISGIEDCAMVSLNGDSNSYDIGVAFVKLDEDIQDGQEFVDILQDDISQEKTSITQLERPDLIVPVAKIPYMTNSKVDYRKLKAMAETYREGIEKNIQLLKN